MSAARLGQRLGQTNQPEIEARLELEGVGQSSKTEQALGFCGVCRLEQFHEL